MENSENRIVRKRRHMRPEEKYQIFLEATVARAKGIIYIPAIISCCSI